VNLNCTLWLWPNAAAGALHPEAMRHRFRAGRSDSGPIENQIANPYRIVNFSTMRAQWRTCVAVICLALTCSAWAATPTVLNYQGRVSTNGIRFNGHGSLVFSIQDSNGAILWSSGMFPVAGATNVPPTAWRLDVREGACRIQLGHTEARNVLGMHIVGARSVAFFEPQIERLLHNIK
jgi:hypothetical protein